MTMMPRRGRKGASSSRFTSPGTSTPTLAAVENKLLCSFLRRANETITVPPCGAGVSSAIRVQASAISPLRSATAIESLLEGRRADTTVGFDERFLGRCTQTEIGVDDLLDRVRDLFAV